MYFTRVERIAEPKPPPGLLAALAVLVLAIGYVHYRSGPEIGFALFYLVPVAAAGWWFGRAGALVIASLAACSWFAADYLIHVDPFISLINGLTRLIIFMTQGWLIAALRDDRRREAELARTDPTTHIPNSRAFLEALRNAPRQPGNACVMFIDLDNFKNVNDRYGHAAGDDVLETFAARLLETIRPDDVAARVGGDEFAILLRDVAAPAAESIARRIIAATDMVARDYPGTNLGASVGIAIGAAADAERLLRHADQAMYEAKARGKGLVSTAITTGSDERHAPVDVGT